MTNVVRLNGAVAGDPVATVVERLEELLALARSGQLRGVCYGLVLPAGRTQVDWASDGACWNDMAAAIFDLQSDMARCRAMLDPSRHDNVTS